MSEIFPPNLGECSARKCGSISCLFLGFPLVLRSGLADRRVESLGERICEGLGFGSEELQEREAKAKKVLESISLGVWSSSAT